MTRQPRVPLYARLPEIYRVRDAEQTPPGQLQAYLRAAEHVLGAVHENIEALHHDLFIDSCEDWVIPYIADLLGTTHLKGDARTLRADVADTIPLRRRKGTLSAIERLAQNLTEWPARAVELRTNLGWTQHLNHQRPDRGGLPPYGQPDIGRSTPRIGGTVAVRDPAMLSLIGTALDPYAYTADFKRADKGARRINLPNLAVYLWRLAAYRLQVTRPLLQGVGSPGAPPADTNQARFVMRLDLDPLDRPVRLFNTYRKPQRTAVDGVQRLTEPDAVSAPILPARLESDAQAGNPSAYISVDAFDDTVTPPQGLDLGDTGLQVYFPASILDGVDWRFRADNLCAWEDGIARSMDAHEISLDPEIGRMMIGLASAAERDILVDGGGNPTFFMGYSYGAPGPVGAHPVSRERPSTIGTELRVVDGLSGGQTLQQALDNLHLATGPVIVEIRDSLVHDLNPETLSGAQAEGGSVSVQLNHSLTIRAISGSRPVIRLRRPLSVRPVDPGAPQVTSMALHLEGVYLTRGSGFPVTRALISRAALARLECTGVTLDPGGHIARDGSRTPIRPALNLANDFGFADADDFESFDATPEIILTRCITGPLRIDDSYRLRVSDTIVDAGAGPNEPPARAISSATNPASDPGAALSISGVTFLGSTHVREARGAGGIFAHRLTVWNNQVGCLKQCYFSGLSDRLPPNQACVSGQDARLAFTNIYHGNPAYGQLAQSADPTITTRGPGDDAMGAYGFQLNAHKWTNLSVRLREFMPVGVRVLMLPLT